MNTKNQNNRRHLVALITLITLALFMFLLDRTLLRKVTSPSTTISIPVPSPTPLPTPTPKPLTFTELNALYGPCTHTPTLMYHHIAPVPADNTPGRWLYVSPETFESQLQYLTQKGFAPITPQQLINFFDQGTPLPKKSILLTFDDGYDDFATYALPLLSKYNIPATLFLPTGLADNPGYLNWATISSFPTSIFIGNHTWSHAALASNQEKIITELTTAQTQLHDHGYGIPKVFAYPYGTNTPLATKILGDQNFLLAFTTAHGSTLCKKQRLTLPRIRVGNSPLSSFGL